MKIGIFGGSFDPPHYGHLIVADHVADALALDKVLFIPSFIAPHKQQSGPAPAEHRLNMTRLAVFGAPHFDCLDIEVMRTEVSYTVHTLEELSKRMPGDSLTLIIGMDNYRTFHQWKEPARILQMATLAVMDRPGYPRQVNEVIGTDRSVFVDVPAIGISSSAIRSRVREGHSIRFLVPDAVREYIGTHALYR
ncbi:MAG: nicotinate (nicotinamide) nucleotide adenylyltransferase [Bacteroidetes bacterium]|nr:nicotinate (nicotinamide) nucleotide adenylyltransferase [Bacteroidota bacterium]